jgi:integrase
VSLKERGELFMPLTVLGIKNAQPKEKPYKLTDGGGLYLLVNPNGSRLWRMNYRYQGKYKTLALGTFPTMSLVDAREARARAKRSLMDNVDPSATRKSEKTEVKSIQIGSFRSVAIEWFETKQCQWETSYSLRLFKRLETYVFPEIGAVPIQDIEPLRILDVLRKIEAKGLGETTSRLLQLCSSIFRYAVITGHTKTDPTNALKGALKPRPRAKKRAAIKASELPEFFKAISDYPLHPQTKLAIVFVLHTFVRTSEARYATWNEFEDFDSSTPLWRIPEERMKMRREFLVPLSATVVDILRRLKKYSRGSDYVFSNNRVGVISENTMLYGLYRMGYHSRATIHGFRGTASTILNESNLFNRDWIEKQLAHEDDTVRGVYNSAEWLTSRRAMMTWYSNYLDETAKFIGVKLESLDV